MIQTKMKKLNKFKLREFMRKHFISCGCGMPGAVTELVYSVLKHYEALREIDDIDQEILVNNSFWFKLVGDNTVLMYFILYQIDNAGLISHGANIRTSSLNGYEGEWIDEWDENMSGRLLLESLERYKDDFSVIYN